MIGQLDRVIYFYQRDDVRDDFGGLSEQFIEYSRCFANVSKKPVSDDNTEISGKQTAERNINFIIRYRTDLNEDMIVKFDDELGTKYYKILSINEMTSKRRRGFIEIEAVKYDLDINII